MHRLIRILPVLLLTLGALGLADAQARPFTRTIYHTPPSPEPDYAAPDCDGDGQPEARVDSSGTETPPPTVPGKPLPILKSEGTAIARADHTVITYALRTQAGSTSETLALVRAAIKEIADQAEAAGLSPSAMQAHPFATYETHRKLIGARHHLDYYIIFHVTDANLLLPATRFTLASAENEGSSLRLWSFRYAHKPTRIQELQTQALENALDVLHERRQLIEAATGSAIEPVRLDKSTGIIGDRRALSDALNAQQSRSPLHFLPLLEQDQPHFPELTYTTTLQLHYTFPAALPTNAQ